MRNGRTYTLGFVLSLLLTVMAFSFVAQGALAPQVLLLALVALALLQLVVQLVCFLHLGREKAPWSVAAFAFAIFTVVVLVGGTLWIMGNLKHQDDMLQIFKEGVVSPQTHDD